MISSSLQLAFVLFLSNVLLYSAAPPLPPVSFWFSFLWGRSWTGWRHGAQRCFSVWSCHVWGGAACPRRSFSGCWVQRATGIIQTGQKSSPRPPSEDPVSCWWQNHPFRSASLAAPLSVVLPHTTDMKITLATRDCFKKIQFPADFEQFLCSSGPFYRGGWCELSSSAHCPTTNSQGIWISTVPTSSLYLNWTWLWSGLPKANDHLLVVIDKIAVSLPLPRFCAPPSSLIYPMMTVSSNDLHRSLA